MPSQALKPLTQTAFDLASPDDNEPQTKEGWLDEVGYIEAIDISDIDQILCDLGDGNPFSAMKRFREAVDSAWKKEEAIIAADKALARAYSFGKVPSGFDD